MKPEYSFFKNFKYAREGFIEVLKKETSFKIEVALAVVLGTVACFLPYPVFAKIILVSALFIPLIAELLNSAVERVVDMVTQEYNELAKYAKDAAAAAVMFSLALCAGIWLAVIIYFWQ